MVAPKWTQYVAEAGEFEVAIGDNMTYTIRGHMKGGSIQDGGSIMENEAGVAFAFTGRLLISDYSEDYEDPDDPDTPDDPAPEVPEVTMSTGSCIVTTTTSIISSSRMPIPPISTRQPFT